MDEPLKPLDALVREIRREAGRVRAGDNAPPGLQYAVSADDLDDWAERIQRAAPEPRPTIREAECREAMIAKFGPCPDDCAVSIAVWAARMNTWLACARAAGWIK